MPSCERSGGFVPLGGSDEPVPFRPFGGPAPAAEPAPAPSPDPLAVAYEAGRTQGRADARPEREQLERDLAQTVAAVGAWREEVRTHYTQAIVGLALAVARRIVGEELEARPERWAAMVARAIGDLVERDRVVVRVPPRLAAVLRAHPPVAGATAIGIVEDPALEAGACFVEGGRGDVECGVDAQLEAIARALEVER